MHNLTGVVKKLLTSAALELQYVEHELLAIDPVEIHGKIVSAVGNIVITGVKNIKIGDLCLIFEPNGDFKIHAEVIAIDRDQVKLLPYGSVSGISKMVRIKKVSDQFSIKVGDWLCGKIINGLGRLIGTIDGKEYSDEYLHSTQVPVNAPAPDPLKKPIIQQQLETGIKAIDLFVSCGIGQRIAIFAGPGMGKTTLMGMILRNAVVDIVVIALIGERGREVREFIDLELHPEVRNKCVLVVATSDRPSAEQLKAAYVAQSIAEYFRDQGKNVLLFADSITRFARAQREVSLASGEPITRGGYPPSVFLAFPQLMERAGNNELGSITAFYTVLMEGENTQNDPIADEVRSIIDGHIILSRALAEQGHYPAIDILASLSRVADRIITPDHVKAAHKLKMLLAKYNELEFLIRVGEYKAGNDAVADEAIKKHPLIMKFLQQRTNEKSSLNEIINQLINLANR